MSSSSVETLFSYFDSQQEQILEDLFTFLRFESISSENENTAQVNDCAKWLAEYLKKVGLKTEIWETARHPVVYSSWMNAGSDKPTLLIYGHYDVQPVDPIELWQSPPFQPTVRDGEIYARGSVDDKAQCFYVITAVQALLEKYGKLPVNLKLCIEGEEEISSPSLGQIVNEKKEELQADHFLVVDLGFHDAEKPAVTLGIRGVTSVNLEVIGTNVDLHSGEHGGIAYNPNHALVELLTKLRDPSGKIMIPGFYEDVKEISKEERSKLSFDFSAADYAKLFGGTPSGGEKAYTPLESAWLRPTVELNGVSGGYSGDGFKTVIPARANAKLSCRLVPNQNPAKINKLLIDFLKENAPEGVTVEATTIYEGGEAVRSDISSKTVKAASESFTEVCKTPCSYILAGGSIPIASTLAKISGAETVLIGYALPGDNLHAPNEHFGIDRIRKGHATIGRILEKLGE